MSNYRINVVTKIGHYQLICVNISEYTCVSVWYSWDEEWSLFTLFQSVFLIFVNRSRLERNMIWVPLKKKEVIQLAVCLPQQWQQN